MHSLVNVQALVHPSREGELSVSANWSQREYMIESLSIGKWRSFDIRRDPSGMLTKDYEKQCEVNAGIDDAMHMYDRQCGRRKRDMLPGQFQCAQPTKTLYKRLLELDYKWAEIELCARYIISTTQP